MSPLTWVLVVTGALVWAACAVVFALGIGRVIRNRDRQVPRGWHRYDPECACAGCERKEPSSPYLRLARDDEP